ncbi:hypothetical protein MNBD_GAMMA01-1308 [hydrothermal vent metagenome]|uniref:Uncharacterized protein n=1 Tax=hydrothermal vent metagenome TaxID=652676 RepID=A0A3B0V7J1_9ZZZZ
MSEITTLLDAIREQAHVNQMFIDTVGLALECYKKEQISLESTVKTISIAHGARHKDLMELMEEYKSLQS